MCNCKKKKSITQLKKEFDDLKKKTEELNQSINIALKSQNNSLDNTDLFFKD